MNKLQSAFLTHNWQPANKTKIKRTIVNFIIFLKNTKNQQIIILPASPISLLSNTCFQTSLPVYFYGLSNGKVVVLFASSKTDFAYVTTIKWIIAEHFDFEYNFETRELCTTDNEKISIEEFTLFADNLEQRIKVIATIGNFSTSDDAQKYFNQNVFNMLLIQNQANYAMEYF